MDEGGPVVGQCAQTAVAQAQLAEIEQAGHRIGQHSSRKQAELQRINTELALLLKEEEGKEGRGEEEGEYCV